MKLLKWMVVGAGILFMTGQKYRLNAAEDMVVAPDLMAQIQKEDPHIRIFPSKDDLVSGDFNGDGRADYALILVEPVGWTVKAYHAQPDGHFTSFNLSEFGTTPDEPSAYKPQQFR